MPRTNLIKKHLRNMHRILPNTSSLRLRRLALSSTIIKLVDPLTCSHVPYDHLPSYLKVSHQVFTINRPVYVGDGGVLRRDESALIADYFRVQCFWGLVAGVFLHAFLVLVLKESFAFFGTPIRELLLEGEVVLERVHHPLKMVELVDILVRFE